MTTKKIHKINFKNKRVLFCEIGLAMVLLFVLSAFTWGTPCATASQLPEGILKDIIPASVQDTVPFAALEDRPTFMGGGEYEFAKWVNEHLEYPEAARENRAQGRIIVQFVIDTEGNVTNITILRGIDPALDNEVVRVVSMSPKWTPGKQNGVPVPVKHVFPVTFRVEKDTVPVTEKDNTPYTEKDTIPYTELENKPKFMGGGEDEFNKWMYDRLEYPENARENEVEGIVVVGFVINTEGKVTNVKILRGAYFEFDREVLRVVSKSPRWTPGRLNGVPVSVGYIFPVTFQLDKDTIPELFEDLISVAEKDINPDAMLEFLVSPIRIDDQPKFMGGGEDEFNKWVCERLEYSESVRKTGVQGRVWVQFMIDLCGNVFEVAILRGIDPVLDNEVVRVVSMSPKWTPGKLKGEPECVRYAMPITFRLKEGETIPVAKKDIVLVTEDDVIPIARMMPEEKPKFKGGEENDFTEWVYKRLKYPESARKKGVQGRVIVQFVIDTEGKVTDVKILRGAHFELDREVLRVVSKSPKWTPGKQRGKLVRVKYAIPITFRLK